MFNLVGIRGNTQRTARRGVRNDTFGVSLFASLVIHVLVILLGFILVRNNNKSRQHDYFPIDLVEVPTRDSPLPTKKVETPPAKPMEKLKTPPPAAKAPSVKSESTPPLPPIKEDPAKPLQAKPVAPTKLEPPPSFASTAPIEGGGNEAGAGNLLGKGDIGIVPETGSAGGGGGTAASGLGRSSGAPGLPAQSILKTNREAKPIQIVRAAYPPMALRAGLESDVALRIEVDPAGNVTKTEITKSGGSGFDEEALKAVQQSRFEPAQRDGHSVPAEFTYVYRFRLRK